MFKKLLSNLPFNPSLIGQVSFYAKRMHQETAIRRVGLIFVLLAFFVQFFAVISPPEPSLAASGNDIIQLAPSTIYHLSSIRENNCTGRKSHLN